MITDRSYTTHSTRPAVDDGLGRRIHAPAERSMNTPGVTPPV
jgi:hypothetical protein